MSSCLRTNQTPPRTNPLLALPQLSLENGTEGLHPDDSPAGCVINEKSLARNCRIPV